MSTGIKTDAPKKPITALKSVILYVLNSNAGAMFEASSGVVRRHRRSADMTSVRIPLNSRKYPGLYAIVDESDAPRVNEYDWRPRVVRTKHHTTIYAVGRRRGSGRKGETVAMHRFVLALPRGEGIVDHINHDGLDNRRCNLRLVDPAQSLANTRYGAARSGYKGVHWNGKREKWEVWISVRGVRQYLGLFERPEDGAAAYNRAALEAWGEFAYINDIPEEALTGDESLAMSSRLGATLTSQCAHCGEEFTYVRAGTRKRKHCSVKCRCLYNDARYRERVRAARGRMA